jgi:glutamate-5-semialdehyde dehydrogenase
MRGMGRAAREAAAGVGAGQQRAEEPRSARRGGGLRARRPMILAANERDMREARRRVCRGAAGSSALDDKRVEAMARGLEDIERLADPIGTVLAEWTRPNGMTIQRCACLWA